jgi:hypothetical protein
VIWGIFVSEGTGGFPNFYPIALHSTREKAIEDINTLPKDKNYQLLELPLNRNFAFYHKKTGKLIGMDGIRHEHFHFKDNNEALS